MFIKGRAYYPDEDQGAGVSNFVLPLRHLGHGELTGAGAAAQDLTHLQTTTTTTTTNISVYTYSSSVEDMDSTITKGSVPEPSLSLIAYYIFPWWELCVNNP